MAVETRKERLRAILWRTLDEQLQSEAGATDPSGNRRRLTGPWGAFFDEHSAWDGTTQLSRDLYLELKGQFDDNLIREILLAAADVKISRTTLAKRKIELLQATAGRHGFEIVTCEHQWILRADRGKGGWANRVERLAEPGEAGAVSNVYIASDSTLADTGRMLDEAGEDDLFGALLGIPACCREAFDRSKSLAAEKQNDFVPYVLENTCGDMPYDWRLNYTAQYFGFSLLSFFPCSFRCPAAAAVADSTLSMLAGCDAAWAKRFVELQQTNVLYTENGGLHLFRAHLRNGLIAYDPRDLQSSEATELAYLLKQGDRLEVSGQHAVQVYRGSTKIGAVAGEDTCMCAFY
jgi:hypothetical protein